MPEYKSFKGIWTPKKEETYVDYALSKDKRNKGRKSEFYSGPDRAAQQQLDEAGQEFFGGDITRDPENIMRARQMNMSIEEFLKLNEPPTEKQAKAEEDKKTAVVDHALPTPKRGVQPQGGGVTIRGKLSDDMPV